MTDDDIRLAEPDERWEAAYLDYLADFARAGERGDEVFSPGDDFGAYVARLRDNARGVGLPEGYVPAETYWLVAGGRIVGSSGLRLALTDSLLDYGGNIGYRVRPSDRRKGHAARMLALMLAQARRHGLGRVLVTCDKTNVASAKVIERSGGVLDSESYSPRSKRMTRRYWIELPRGGAPA